MGRHTEHPVASTVLALAALVAVQSVVACGSNSELEPTEDTRTASDAGPDLVADLERDASETDVGDAATDSAVDGSDAELTDVSADLDAVEPDSAPVPWTDGRCNGHASLCERRYDEVAYATSHNAFATGAEGFFAPNHELSMAAQLDLGVRGLMLDVHPQGELPWLCHGECVLGSRTLVAGLRDIDAFLDANPGEVITIILESYVEPAALEVAFVESGLAERLHVQAPDAPFPTLGELVRSGRRVLVFSDRDGGALPWLHDVWTFAFETHWSVQSADGFGCDPNRGDTGNALFILNHFLSDPLPAPELAETVNHDPLLTERAQSCAAVHGRPVNFVTLDFVGIGDLFAAVDALNGT